MCVCVCVLLDYSSKNDVSYFELKQHMQPEFDCAEGKKYWSSIKTGAHLKL